MSMRDPVAKRRPLIDLEEFERRLRQPSATARRTDDPLVELARLHAGDDDPYKTVFEPLDPHFPAAEHEAQPAGAEWDDRVIGGDFADIEAGLLNARHEPPEPELQGFDDPRHFADGELASSHWSYEDGVAAPQQHADGGEDEIRSKRPLYLMGAIIVLGIAGIGASFAFKTSGSGPQEIATIRAADGPAKIQPETSDSAEAPSQDASIFNRVPQPAPTALANNAEQPVDLSQVVENAPHPVGARPHAAGGAASVPVPPPPEAAHVEGQREPLSIAALIEPKKVKTVSVRPDGTVLPNDKAPQMPQAAHAAGDPAKASTPKTTARVATTPKTPDAGQSSQTGTSAKPKPVQVADAGSGAASVRPSQGSGAFAVQLAAPQSEQEARDLQARLTKKFGNDLSGFHPSIHKAAIGDKTVYRVRVGNLSREEATAMCQKVQAGGGACFVAKN